MKKIADDSANPDAQCCSEDVSNCECKTNSNNLSKTEVIANDNCSDSEDDHAMDATENVMDLEDLGNVAGVIDDAQVILV